MNIAFITGITGQDGSYLTELLLEKKYEVWGMIRRSSNINTQRIDYLLKNEKLILKYGDMSDTTCFVGIFNEIKKKYTEINKLEIYNLAAQSHVKVSFEMPEYTAMTDAMGTLKLLEAVRACQLEKIARIYQASTSEMFGKVQEIPQKETTPFYPRSPYGVAKLYAYWIIKNYRESYNMFCCNGILFNHESMTADSPVIFKNNKVNSIDIKPICEVVKYHTLKNKKTSIDENKKIYQEIEPNDDLYVWDQKGWTKVTFASGYPHDSPDNPKNPKMIISKNTCFMATDTHPIIMEDNSEKDSKDIKIGDRVKLIDLPNSESDIVLDDFEAELLGLLAGDGYIDEQNIPVLYNKDENIRNRAVELWEKICAKYKKNCYSHYSPSYSGFNPENLVGKIRFSGNWFITRDELYNEDKTKRVPKKILNSPKEIKLAFLKGYNMADGLKKNNCTYEFKNFKTNSQTLACGLIYLIKSTTGQDYNINVEEKLDENNIKRHYYSINILSNSRFSTSKSNDKVKTVLELHKKGVSQRGIERQTKISRTFIRQVTNSTYEKKNQYKQIENNVVKKIIECPDYDGWFYDLETESGTYFCGVGQGVVHNSPRRGHNFVTRKITIGLGKILKGEEDKLVLGNLDSLRDWGHAKDYVEGMWLILQQDRPDDYVLSTGKMYTVREFVEKSFALRGFNIKWKGEGISEIGYDEKTGKELIFVSDKYFRPAEVDLLIGDSTKAKTELSWNPKISFDELIKEMVDCDCP